MEGRAGRKAKGGEPRKGFVRGLLRFCEAKPPAPTPPARSVFCVRVEGQSWISLPSHSDARTRAYQLCLFCAQTRVLNTVWSINTMSSCAQIIGDPKWEVWEPKLSITCTWYLVTGTTNYECIATIVTPYCFDNWAGERTVSIHCQYVMSRVASREYITVCFGRCTTILLLVLRSCAKPRARNFAGGGGGRSGLGPSGSAGLSRSARQGPSNRPKAAPRASTDFDIIM
jgi:hypothetical protein